MHPIWPTIVIIGIFMGDGPHPTTVASTAYRYHRLKKKRDRELASSQLHHMGPGGLVFYHD